MKIIFVKTTVFIIFNVLRETKKKKRKDRIDFIKNPSIVFVLFETSLVLSTNYAACSST